MYLLLTGAVTAYSAFVLGPEFWNSPVLLQAIIAITTIFTLIWNSRSQRKKVEAKVDTQTETIQAAAVVREGKLDEVHTLVNSRLSEALAEIESLKQQLLDRGSHDNDQGSA